MPKPGALPQNFNGPVPSDFQQQPMTMRDVEAIRQHAESLPPGPEKAQAMALYDQAREQLPNDADASYNDEPQEGRHPGFSTPEQVRSTKEEIEKGKTEREIAAASAKKENELKATRDAEKQRAIDAFSLDRKSTRLNSSH